jgi:hypothetical protein
MKAKKVYEFKQGQNPYDTMNIGSNRPFKEGDEFEVLQNLYWVGNGQDGNWTTKEPKFGCSTILKNTVFKINSLKYYFGDYDYEWLDAEKLNNKRSNSEETHFFLKQWLYANINKIIKRINKF